LQLNEPDHDTVRRFVEAAKSVHPILPEEPRGVARIDPGRVSKADFADEKKTIFQAGYTSPGPRRAQYNPDGNRNSKGNDDVRQRIPHALLNTAKEVNIQSNKGSILGSEIVTARQVAEP
jgi:hypothetical protein